MGRTDRMLDQLRAQARAAEREGFHSFQDPSYQMQAFDRAGDQFKRSGISGAGAAPLESPTPGNIVSAAQFGIKMTRLTAAIAQPLPVPVFNPVDAEDFYRKTLGPLLPPGVVVSSLRYGSGAGLPDTLEITYTSGALSDIVNVTCTSMPYPAFLRSLIADKFAINKIRMTLSDPAQLAQFDQKLTAASYTLFGLGEQNETTPSNFRSPQQYQDGIVDVDLDFKFDKQTGLAFPVLPVANLAVQMNFFCPRFEQTSARYW